MSKQIKAQAEDSENPEAAAKQLSHSLPRAVIPNLQNTGEKSTVTDNSGYSALIVDDNPSFQKLLALSLSMQPQIGEIDFANNGESAITKANSQKYDLIFMDAMMPGIDGYETCARIRKIPDYKTTPIIMVTGLDSPSDEAKAIIAGTTTFVTKPVQQIPFKKLLTRVLSLMDYRKNLTGNTL